MMLRLAFLSLLAVGSNAFVAPMSHVRTHQSVTARNLIMTEEEITAILDKAHGCVESECAVDDVDDLIAELKDQQKVLSERLETIMNVVSHLQHANTKENRKTDDVRAIVKDMLRVFTTQVSLYDVLQPNLFNSLVPPVANKFYIPSYPCCVTGRKVCHGLQWRYRRWSYYRI